MVTMRRDVAAMNGNRVFDRPDRDSGMTDYDIFMQEKKRQEITRNLGSGTVSYTNDVNAQTNYFGYSARVKEEPKVANSYENYDEYMKAQLHRSAGGKLLSQEEFYADRYLESKQESAGRQKNVAAKKRGLNKNGKIFVAVYVLVVMIVASIIVTVNTGKSDNVERANAKQEGAIGSLAIEAEETETNWFDEVCDSFSNK